MSTEAENDDGVSAETKRLTHKKYTSAVLLWELGNHSLAEICSAIDYNNPHYLGKKMRLAGVVKGSRAKETEEAARVEVTKSVQKDALVLAQRIKDSKEDFYQLNSFIRRAIRSKLAQVVKDQMLFSTIYGEIKTLKLAQDLLSGGTDQAWKLLGLDKDFNADDEMPRLVITELTAKEVEEIQREPTDADLEDPDLQEADVDLEEGEEAPIDEDDEVVAEE